MPQKQQENDLNFPYHGPAKPILMLGWLLTAITALALLLGIFLPDYSYPTTELKENFYLNDFATLLIGLPILVLILVRWKQYRLISLLALPGVSFFFIYNYLIYLLSIPLGVGHIFYGLIIALSILLLFRLHGATEAQELEAQTQGKIRERLSGIFPLLFGLMFLARAIGVLTNTDPLSGSEIALNIADILISLVWIGSGLALFRKKRLGYRYGVAALVSGGMLMVALLVFLGAKPLVGLPFSMVDFSVILFGAILFLIPLGLVIKGLRN